MSISSSTSFLWMYSVKSNGMSQRSSLNFFLNSFTLIFIDCVFFLISNIFCFSPPILFLIWFSSSLTQPVLKKDRAVLDFFCFLRRIIAFFFVDLSRYSIFVFSVSLYLISYCSHFLHSLTFWVLFLLAVVCLRRIVFHF